MSFVINVDESKLVVGTLYLLDDPTTFGECNNGDNITLDRGSVLLYLGKETNSYAMTKDKFPMIYLFLHKDNKIFRELIKNHWFRELNLCNTW